eukprot:14506282-Alexandrium_andersonii.AAC.1
MRVCHVYLRQQQMSELLTASPPLGTLGTKGNQTKRVGLKRLATCKNALKLDLRAQPVGKPS